MPAMKSVKALALFVLLVGGPMIGFLAFALNFSFTFALFGTRSAMDRFLGYVVLLGPLPLWVGAVLLFFRRAQKLGAKITLSGSLILTAYLVIVYAREILDALSVVEKLILYGLVPLAVLTVNAAAYRIYKLTKLAAPAATSATPQP